MGKDVRSLIACVSCGRRVHAELPLSMVLFPMGQLYTIIARQAQASQTSSHLPASCLMQTALESGLGGRKDM